MTTQSKDPISEIKKAEETANTKLEEQAVSFEKKLIMFEEELNKKTQEFEESRKEQGNLKLNNVKKEAGELYKSKISTSEKEKNESIRSAEARKSEAVDTITKYFLDHVK